MPTVPLRRTASGSPCPRPLRRSASGITAFAGWSRMASCPPSRSYRARRTKSEPTICRTNGWRSRLGEQAARVASRPKTNFQCFQRLEQEGYNERRIAMPRKSWLFAGSDRGGQRAAAMYSLIGTAKLNDVDPQAWLGDVLARIAEHPAHKIDELLPWNWRPRAAPRSQAA